MCNQLRVQVSLPQLLPLLRRMFQDLFHAVSLKVQVSEAHLTLHLLTTLTKGCIAKYFIDRTYEKIEIPTVRC